MHLETIRSLTAHLQDPTRGLGAQLAALPLESGDTRPTTPTIADEASSFAVAIGRPPATLPTLTVELERVTGLDPERVQPIRDGQVTLLLRYCDRETAADAALRDAHIVMRALHRSLDAIPWPLVRNAVECYAITGREVGAVMQPLGDAWALVALRVTLNVRDTLT